MGSTVVRLYGQDVKVETCDPEDGQSACRRIFGLCFFPCFSIPAPRFVCLFVCTRASHVTVYFMCSKQPDVHANTRVTSEVADMTGAEHAGLQVQYTRQNEGRALFYLAHLKGKLQIVIYCFDG